MSETDPQDRDQAQREAAIQGDPVAEAERAQAEDAIPAPASSGDLEPGTPPAQDPAPDAPAKPERKPTTYVVQERVDLADQKVEHDDVLESFFGAIETRHGEAHGHQVWVVIGRVEADGRHQARDRALELAMSIGERKKGDVGALQATPLSSWKPEEPYDETVKVTGWR